MAEANILPFDDVESRLPFIFQQFEVQRRRSDQNIVEDIEYSIKGASTFNLDLGVKHLPVGPYIKLMVLDVSGANTKYYVQFKSDRLCISETYLSLTPEQFAYVMEKLDFIKRVEESKKLFAYGGEIKIKTKGPNEIYIIRNSEGFRQKIILDMNAVNALRWHYSILRLCTLSL